VIQAINTSLSNSKIIKIIVVFLWLVSVLLVKSSTVFASDVNDRRLQIALSIFPKIVAVDTGIREKLDKDNRLLLAFISKFDDAKSHQLSNKLQSKIKKIAGLSYKTVTIKLNGRLDIKTFSPAAMFLTERLPPKSFNRIMRFAKRNRILVFSPFTGDVERGATVGIFITSRVKPYFNILTLKDSSININPLLMKVSKRYE